MTPPEDGKASWCRHTAPAAACHVFFLDSACRGEHHERRSALSAPRADEYRPYPRLGDGYRSGWKSQRQCLNWKNRCCESRLVCKRNLRARVGAKKFAQHSKRNTCALVNWPVVSPRRARQRRVAACSCRPFGRRCRFPPGSNWVEPRTRHQRCRSGPRRSAKCNGPDFQPAQVAR